MEKMMWFLYVLTGQSAEAFAPHQDPMQEVPDPLSRPSLYYGICGAGALIIVISTILCAAYTRRRIKAKRHRDHCTLTLVTSIYFYFKRSITIFIYIVHAWRELSGLSWDLVLNERRHCMKTNVFQDLEKNEFSKFSQ